MYFRFVAFSRRWLHPRSVLVAILACSATAMLLTLLIVPSLDRGVAITRSDKEAAGEPLQDQDSSGHQFSPDASKKPVLVLAVAKPSEPRPATTVLVVALTPDAEVPGSEPSTTETTSAEPPTTQPTSTGPSVSQPSTDTPPGSGAEIAGRPTTKATTSDPPVTEPPAAATPTSAPTTAPTTKAPTTGAPTTQSPTSQSPTTEPPTPVTEPPPAKPQPASSIQPCSNPVRIEMKTSSIGSALGQAAGKPCVVIEMQPGNYPSIPASGLEQVTMTCAQANGCAVARIVVSRVQQLIVEGMRFTGGHDYGIMAYETDRLLVRNNQFINASNGHDISLKNLVGYTEILNNTFVECTRHCLELGQNGNIRTRPSTSGVAVVRGNVFERPLINAITQRALCTLIIEDNEFIDVAGWAVQTWPYWAKYPFGRSGDDGTLYVPKCPTPKDQVNGQTGPMRTTVANNKFSGRARMSFEGRGVADDKVEVTGNTGSFTCRFIAMAGPTQAATADEETTAAPSLVPGSQC